MESGNNDIKLFGPQVESLLVCLCDFKQLLFEIGETLQESAKFQTVFTSQNRQKRHADVFNYVKHESGIFTRL